MSYISTAIAVLGIVISICNLSLLITLRGIRDEIKRLAEKGE